MRLGTRGDIFPPAQQAELERLIGSLIQQWNVEHANDNSHRSIHTAVDALIYERGRKEAIGDWLDYRPFFAATDFTSNNGTAWTVVKAMVTELSYLMFGAHTMLISGVLDGTTLAAGGPTALLLKIPNRFTILTTSLKRNSMALFSDNGVQTAGVVEANGATPNQIILRRRDNAALAAAAATTSLHFQLAFQLGDYGQP